MPMTSLPCPRAAARLALRSLCAALSLAAVTAACGARSQLSSSEDPAATGTGGDAGGAGAAGGNTASSGGAGGGGGACGALGDACATDVDCCELPCIQGTCAEAPPPCAGDVGSVALLTGLADPYAMGGDATSLFVGQLLGPAQDLLRVPKAGGPADVLVKAVSYVEYIAVAENTVFYSDEDALNAIPIAGGSSPAQLKDAFGPAGFALTKDHVFLAEYFATDLVQIDRATLSAKVLVSGISGIYRVAVSQGEVFFSSFLPGLRRYSTTTGALDVIAPELGNTRALLAYHDDVYFTVPSLQHIYRLPPGSDSPLLVADLSMLGVYPEALVTDGKHLYTTLVTGGDPGLVVRAPLAGGEPEVVVADAGYSPSALVVDQACVYWTDRQTGTVFRARKDPEP